LAFYAPPHGLRAVLTDMAAVLGGTRRVCVARELTKRHEELIRCEGQCIHLCFSKV
jgi:16S rRNA (cytidine1402-2'-O)-methyltransferase